VADKPGGEPSRRQQKADQRVEAVRAFLKTRAEQGEQPCRFSKSRGFSSFSVLPLELENIEGAECRCGFIDWQPKDGKIRPVYVPAHRKGCEVCGRQLRQRYWRELGPILEAAGPLWAFTWSDAQFLDQGAAEKAWAKLLRRLAKAEKQALPIPTDGGKFVLTQASPDELPGFLEVAPVTDLPGQLAAGLLAMTDDPRRRISSTGSERQPGWKQAWQRVQAEAEAARPERPARESAGISPAGSMPTARLWAARLGIATEVNGQFAILDVRESDPLKWWVFADEVGIRKWKRKEEDRTERVITSVAEVAA
jgi:hypothetical protein